MITKKRGLVVEGERRGASASTRAVLAVWLVLNLLSMPAAVAVEATPAIGQQAVGTSLVPASSFSKVAPIGQGKGTYAAEEREPLLQGASGTCYGSTACVGGICWGTDDGPFSCIACNQSFMQSVYPSSIPECDTSEPVGCCCHLDDPIYQPYEIIYSVLECDASDPNRVYYDLIIDDAACAAACGGSVSPCVFTSCEENNTQACYCGIQQGVGFCCASDGAGTIYGTGADCRANACASGLYLINGTVFNTITSLPVAGVDVKTTIDSVLVSDITDASGNYLLTGLHNGTTPGGQTYYVTASLVGFYPNMTAVIIQDDNVTDHHIYLTPFDNCSDGDNASDCIGIGPNCLWCDDQLTCYTGTCANCTGFPLVRNQVCTAPPSCADNPDYSSCQNTGCWWCDDDSTCGDNCSGCASPYPGVGNNCTDAECIELTSYANCTERQDCWWCSNDSRGAASCGDTCADCPNFTINRADNRTCLEDYCLTNATMECDGQCPMDYVALFGYDLYCSGYDDPDCDGGFCRIEDLGSFANRWCDTDNSTGRAGLNDTGTFWVRFNATGTAVSGNWSSDDYCYHCGPADHWTCGLSMSCDINNPALGLCDGQPLGCTLNLDPDADGGRCNQSINAWCDSAGWYGSGVVGWKAAGISPGFQLSDYCERCPTDADCSSLPACTPEDPVVCNGSAPPGCTLFSQDPDNYPFCDITNNQWCAQDGEYPTAPGWVTEQENHTAYCAACGAWDTDGTCCNNINHVCDGDCALGCFYTDDPDCAQNQIERCNVTDHSYCGPGGTFIENASNTTEYCAQCAQFDSTACSSYRIEGYLLDPGGSPIAGATVRLEHHIHGLYPDGHTDGNGLFNFTGVYGGMNRLSFNDTAAYCYDPIAVDVSADDTNCPQPAAVCEQNLSLTAGDLITIHGYVNDDEGNQLFNARVYAHPINIVNGNPSSHLVGMTAPYTTTDTTGRYELSICLNTTDYDMTATAISHLPANRTLYGTLSDAECSLLLPAWIDCIQYYQAHDLNFTLETLRCFDNASEMRPQIDPNNLQDHLINNGNNITLVWGTTCDPEAFFVYRYDDTTARQLPISERIPAISGQASYTWTDTHLEGDGPFNYTIYAVYQFPYSTKYGSIPLSNADAGDPRCISGLAGWCDGADLAVNCLPDYSTENTTCGSGTTCRLNSTGSAVCAQDQTTDCMACGMPLGLFSNWTTSRLSPSGPFCNQVPNCTLERSTTVADNFRNCTDVRSCYDYLSDFSCTEDQCEIGMNCTWQESPDLAELGIGVCRPDNPFFQNCSRCNGEPFNSVFDQCSFERCRLYGACFYINGDANGFGGECVDASQAGGASCSIYGTNEEQCLGETGNRNYTINISRSTGHMGRPLTSGSHAVINRSNDELDIGLCRFDSTCFKDGDGDLGLDPGDDSRVPELFMAHLDGYGDQGTAQVPVSVDYFILDSRAEPTTSLSLRYNPRQGADTNLYWIYPTCPGATYIGPYATPLSEAAFRHYTHYAPSFGINYCMSAAQDRPEGAYWLYAFPTDSSGNYGLVKNYSFYYDTTPPDVTLTLHTDYYNTTPEDYFTNFSLNLTIDSWDGSHGNWVVCSLNMTLPGGEMVPLITPEQYCIENDYCDFNRTYGENRWVRDGTTNPELVNRNEIGVYTFAYECRDWVKHVTSEVRQPYINPDTRVFDVRPFQTFNDSNGIILMLRTPEAITCRYHRWGDGEDHTTFPNGWDAFSVAPVPAGGDPSCCYAGACGPAEGPCGRDHIRFTSILGDLGVTNQTFTYEYGCRFDGSDDLFVNATFTVDEQPPQHGIYAGENWGWAYGTGDVFDNTYWKKDPQYIMVGCHDPYINVSDPTLATNAFGCYGQGLTGGGALGVFLCEEDVDCTPVRANAAGVALNASFPRVFDAYVRKVVSIPTPLCYSVADLGGNQAPAAKNCTVIRVDNMPPVIGGFGIAGNAASIIVGETLITNGSGVNLTAMVYNLVDHTDTVSGTWTSPYGYGNLTIDGTIRAVGAIPPTFEFLRFRRQWDNENESYALAFTPGTGGDLRLMKYVGAGSANPLGSATVNTELNVSYPFRLTAIGNRIDLYFNGSGTPNLSYTDSSNPYLFGWVEANASANYTVTGLGVHDPTLVSPLRNVSIGVNGTWADALLTPQTASFQLNRQVGLNSGLNTITIYAEDNATSLTSPYNKAEIDITVYSDTVGPQISPITPSVPFGGDTYGQNITINLTVQDVNWTAKGPFLLANTTANITITPDLLTSPTPMTLVSTQNTVDSYGYLIETAYDPNTGRYTVSPGTYLVTVTAADLFGNVATANGTFDVSDTTGSSAAYNITDSDFPLGLGYAVHTRGRTYTFEANFSEWTNVTDIILEPAGVSGLQPTAGLSSVFVNETVVNGARTAYTYSISVPTYSYFDNLSHDTPRAQIRIVGTDTSGNDILISTYPFRVDTSAPDPPLFQPHLYNGGTVYINDPGITISGWEADREADVNISIMINSDIEVNASTLSAYATLLGTGTLAQPAAVGAGYVLLVGDKTIEFTIAGFLEIVGANRTGSVYYGITDVSYNAGLSQTRVNVTPTIETPAPAGQAVNTYDSDRPTGWWGFSTLTLPTGNNSVYAFGIDQFGNRGLPNITYLFYDGQAPSTGTFQLPNQTRTSDNRTNISVTLNDGPAGAYSGINITTINLTINSSSIAQTYGCGGTITCRRPDGNQSQAGDQTVVITYAPPAGTLPFDQYDMTIYAEDRAGNNLSQSWWFLITEASPGIPNLTLDGGYRFSDAYYINQTDFIGTLSYPDTHIYDESLNISVLTGVGAVGYTSLSLNSFNLSYTSFSESLYEHSIRVDATKEINATANGTGVSFHDIVVDQTAPQLWITSKNATNTNTFVVAGNYLDQNLTATESVDGYPDLNKINVTLRWNPTIPQTSQTYATISSIADHNTNGTWQATLIGPDYPIIVNVTTVACDRAGNCGTVQQTMVYDDREPTASQTGGDDGWTNGNVSVTVSGDDSSSSPNSGVCQVVIDGTRYDGSSHTIVYSTEQSQSHTYSAIDCAGNPSATGSFMIQIDRSNPVTAINRTSPTVTYQNDTWYNQTFTVYLDDDNDAGAPPSGVSGTTYCTSGAACDPGTAYTSSGVSVSSQGANYVNYRSGDNAGNSQDVQRYVFYVDTTQPAITVSGVQSAGAPATIPYGIDTWKTADSSVIVSGSVTEAYPYQMYYQVNGSGATVIPFTNTSGTFAYNFTYGISADAALTVWIEDHAGNRDSHTITVLHDAQAPTVNLTGISQGFVYPGTYSAFTRSQTPQLTLITDEPATCVLADDDFATFAQFDTTGGTTHTKTLDDGSTLFSDLMGEQFEPTNSRYVSCRDDIFNYANRTLAIVYDTMPPDVNVTLVKSPAGPGPVEMPLGYDLFRLSAGTTETYAITTLPEKTRCKYAGGKGYAPTIIDDRTFFDGSMTDFSDMNYTAAHLQDYSMASMVALYGADMNNWTGSYTYYVGCEDEAGNLGPLARTDFTVNFTGLVVSITNPASDGAVIPTSSFLLNVSTSKSVNCSYRLDGGATTLMASTNAYVHSQQLSPGEGAHSVLVRCQGYPNLDVNQTRSFTIDTQPPNRSQTPAVTSSTHPEGTWVTGTDAPNPVFQWHFSDPSGSGISRYEYYLSGTGGTVLLDGTVVSGTQTANTTASTIAYNGVSDGQYTYTIQAVDNAGHTSGWETYAIMVNAQGPAVAIATPADGYLSRQESVTLVMNLSDVASCWYRVNGGNATAFGCSSGQQTLTVSGLNNTAIQGTQYTIAVTVNDTGGLTASDSVSITVDDVTPNINSLTVSPNPAAHEEITISFNSDDDVNASLNSVTVGSNPAAYASGQWSYTYTLSTSDGGDGNKTITVRLTDTAGNQNSTTAQVRLDATGPAEPVMWTSTFTTTTPSGQLIGFLNEPGTVYVTDLNDTLVATATTSIVSSCTSEPIYTGAAGTNVIQVLDTLVANGTFTTADYIEIPSQIRPSFRRYDIQTITDVTGQYSHLNLDGTLLANLSGGTVRVCDTPYPSGWFNITVSNLTSGSNRFIIVGEDLLGTDGVPTDPPVEIIYDDAPPQIGGRTPGPNTRTSDSVSAVVFTCTDGQSLVNQSSLSMDFNGTTYLCANASLSCQQNGNTYTVTYSHGSALPYSSYPVTARCADNAGRQASSAWVFQVDDNVTHAPTVNVTNAVYHSATSVYYTSDVQPLVLLDYSLDTPYDVTLSHTGIGADGSTAGSDDPTLVQALKTGETTFSLGVLQPLPGIAGTEDYTFQLNLESFKTYEPGNDSAVGVHAVDIRVDTQAPTIAYTGPLATNNLTNFTVTGTYDETNPAGIAISGDVYGAPVAVTGYAAGAFSATVSFTGSAWTEGNKSLTLAITDLFGRSASQQVQVTYDITAPESQIQSLSQNGRTVTADLANSGGATSCQIKWSAAEAWTSAQTLNASQATAEHTYASDGTYEVSYRCRDQAGNYDPTPATQTASLDQTAPAISAVSASPSPANSIINVSFTATDAHSGIASQAVSIPAANVTCAGIDTVAPDFTYSCNVAGVIADNVPHAINITVNDGSGIPASAIVTASIDTVAPNITTVLAQNVPITSPEYRTNLSWFTARITTSEQAACYYSTTPIAGLPTNAFSATGSTTHTTNLTLNENAYTTYHFKCRDAAGNYPASSASVTVYRDTLPPFIGSVAISPIHASAGTTNYTASQYAVFSGETEQMARVELYLGGTYIVQDVADDAVAIGIDNYQFQGHDSYTLPRGAVVTFTDLMGVQAELQSDMPGHTSFTVLPGQYEPILFDTIGSYRFTVMLGATENDNLTVTIQDRNSSFSINQSLASRANQPLVVQLRALDQLGTGLLYTYPYSLYYDSRAPTIAVTPTNGTYTTNRRQPVVATIQDAGFGVNQSSITARIMTPSGQIQCDTSSCTPSSVNPSYSPATGVLTLTPTSDLTSQNRTVINVTVYAEDGLGNSNRSDTSFIFDTTVPLFDRFSYTPLFVDAGGAHYTNTTQPTVYAIFSETVILTRFTIGSIDALGDGDVSTTDNRTFTVSGRYLAGSQGYLINVTAVPLGRTGNAGSWTDTLYVDADQPTVTIAQPSMALTNVQDIIVAGSCTDYAPARLTVNGQDANCSGGAYSTAHRLSNGANTITVALTDKVGRVANATRNITLDTTIPGTPVLWPLPALSARQTISIIGYVPGEGDTAVVVRNESFEAVQTDTGGPRSGLLDYNRQVQGYLGSTAAFINPGTNPLSLYQDTYLTFSFSGRDYFERFATSSVSSGAGVYRLDFTPTLPATQLPATLNVWNTSHPDNWFNLSVNLRQGNNTFYVLARDQAGNHGSQAGPLTVYYDPALTLNITLVEPADGVVNYNDMFVTNGQTIPVRVTTTLDARCTISHSSDSVARSFQDLPMQADAFGRTHTFTVSASSCGEESGPYCQVGGPTHYHHYLITCEGSNVSVDAQSLPVCFRVNTFMQSYNPYSVYGENLCTSTACSSTMPGDCTAPACGLYDGDPNGCSGAGCRYCVGSGSCLQSCSDCAPPYVYDIDPADGICDDGVDCPTEYAGDQTGCIGHPACRWCPSSATQNAQVCLQSSCSLCGGNLYDNLVPYGECDDLAPCPDCEDVHASDCLCGPSCANVGNIYGVCGGELQECADCSTHAAACVCPTSCVNAGSTTGVCGGDMSGGGPIGGWED
ncbi:hypothetical protein JXB02_03835 [Candidatus Woesearchaeota archaeon]|nr:hypothetical protein [Candidatus Woesearchaeota archaeon]